MSSKFQNKKENNNNALMVLTIDVGNGTCDKLKIFNINNYQEETYDFCAKHNLDFNTMKEINHQIQNVLMNSGALKNEFNFKKKQGKSLYIKKNSFKQDKENYSNKNKNIIHKNSEIDTNKKVVKRYNEKPLNYLTERMKDSNINNNYSSFVHSQRGYTSSTKGSSIKEFNIKTNVKNAFNSLGLTFKLFFNESSLIGFFLIIRNTNSSSKGLYSFTLFFSRSLYNSRLGKYLISFSLTISSK